MRKIILGLFHLIFQLLFVAVVAVTVALLWLQSPPGSQWALAKLLNEANSAQSDYVIEAKGLGSGWPFYITLDEINVADAEGPLASLKDVRLRWSPLQLLEAHINVSSLSAASAIIHRYPQASSGSAESSYNPAVAVSSITLEALQLPDFPHPIKAQAGLNGTLKELVLTLNDVAVEPLAFAVHGELDLSSRPLPQGQLAFSVSDLTHIGTTYNQPLSGSVNGALVLDATGIKLTASADGFAYGTTTASKLTLASQFTLNDGTVDGTLKLEGDVQELALTLGTSFSANSQQVSLRKINGTSPFGSLQGDIAYALESQVVSGKLTARSDDLSNLAKLTGQQIAGSGEITVEPQGDGRQLSWQLATSLSAPVVTELKANGALSVTEDIRLEVTALQGSYEAEPVRLLKPVTLNVTGNSYTLSSLALMYGNARVEAAGLWQPDKLDGTVSLSNLTLPAWPQLGAIKGMFDFKGTPATPILRGTAEFAPVLPQPANVRMVLGYENEAANIKATYSQNQLQLLAADATLRTALNLTKPDLSAWLNAPLTGKANGNIALDWMAEQQMFELPIKRGNVALNVTLSGRANAPEVNGTATLSNGYYLSTASGTELHDLAATATLQGQQVTLSSLSATDGKAGRMTGTGSYTADGTALDLKIENFLMLRLPEATARASADLQLTGPTLTELLLKGTVHIAEAALRIPERLPVSLIRLPVTYQGHAPRQVLEPEVNSTPFALGLDLLIDAPNQIRLEGPGLQSELAGTLNIKGSTVDPDITGYLKLMRGSYEFLGKRLQLTQGQITFDGGTLSNPSLNLVATQEGNGITTSILLRGTAQAPDISYSSSPELPQDEIIARLLFGQSVTQLSPLQAVQLARALASLANGDSGFDLAGDIRRGLGLDQLDVVTDNSAGADSPSSALEVGKYLSDDVYLSTRQGLTPESRRVGVEIKLTPQISVESNTGMENSGNVQLKFQRDY